MHDQPSQALSTTSSPALTRMSRSFPGLKIALAGPKVAAERTRILVGCYPNGKPSDPEVYASAVAAVLAQYPPEIVQRVTDPRVGLVRRCRFLPSIAEIVSACDEEMYPIIRAHRERQRAEELGRQETTRNPTMIERFNRLLAGLADYCSQPDPYRKARDPRGESIARQREEILAAARERATQPAEPQAEEV